MRTACDTSFGNTVVSSVVRGAAGTDEVPPQSS